MRAVQQLDAVHGGRDIGARTAGIATVAARERFTVRLDTDHVIQGTGLGKSGHGGLLPPLGMRGSGCGPRKHGLGEAFSDGLLEVVTVEVDAHVLASLEGSDGTGCATAAERYV